MYFLNETAKIRHRNFRSGSVYLNGDQSMKYGRKAYIGDFDSALSENTPACLKRLFNVGTLRWMVIATLIF